MPSSDEALLAAVADGDRAAFRALYDRHAPWLTLRLARPAGDRDLVDETVQGAHVLALVTLLVGSAFEGMPRIPARLPYVAGRKCSSRRRRIERPVILGCEVPSLTTSYSPRQIR